MIGAEAHRSLLDRVRSRRNHYVADPGFRAWAATSPLTRWVARRQARKLFDLAAGFVYSQVLAACVELRLFDRLRDGPADRADLAASTGVPGETLRSLLDAAVALDLLRARAGRPLRTRLARRGDDRQPGGDGDGRAPRGALPRSRGSGRAPAFAARIGRPRRLLALRRRERSGRDPGRESQCLHTPDGLLAAARHRGRAGCPGDRPVPPPDGPRRRGRDLRAGGRAALARARGDGRRPARGGGAGASALRGGRPRRAGPRDRRGLPPRSAAGRRRPRDAGARAARPRRRRRPRACSRTCTRRWPRGRPSRWPSPWPATPGAEPVGAYFALYLLAMGRGRPRSAAEIVRLLGEAGFRDARAVGTRMPLQTGLVLARR